MAFDWRLPQSRYCIVGNPKVIADDLEVDRYTVNAWGRGQWAIPLHQAFAASASQGDWTYVRWISEQFGAVLKLLRHRDLSLSKEQMINQLVANCGRFFILCDTLKKDEPLSDEDYQRLEEIVEGVKETADIILAQERAKRRSKRQKGNGEGQD